MKDFIQTMMVLGYFILFIPFVCISIIKKIIDYIYIKVERVTYKCAQSVD
jgi:cellobiose-specific phosphotransferase system component IIC